MRDVIFLGDLRKLVIGLTDGSEIEITEPADDPEPRRPGKALPIAIADTPVHVFETADV